MKLFNSEFQYQGFYWTVYCTTPFGISSGAESGKFMKLTLNKWNGLLLVSAHYLRLVHFMGDCNQPLLVTRGCVSLWSIDIWLLVCHLGIFVIFDNACLVKRVNLQNWPKGNTFQQVIVLVFLGTMQVFRRRNCAFIRHKDYCSIINI